MAHQLHELLDSVKLQPLLDSFRELTGLSVAIVDIQGDILFSSSRPTLCTLFYDSELTEENSCRINRAFSQEHSLTCDQKERLCPHGLLDAFEPLTVEGKQIGSLMVGQVFPDTPDHSFYLLEAQKFRFDAEPFLKAVEEIPIVTRQQFDKAVYHLTSLASLLTEQLAARLKSERENRRQTAKLKLYNGAFDSCSDLLDVALDQSLLLTDSSIGYIYEYDEDTELFTLYAWSKEVLPSCSILQKETVYELDKTGLWGEAVRQRKPILTNDYVAPNQYKKGYPEGHVPLTRHLNLPLFRDGRIVAVVGVGNKPSDYTVDDIRDLTLFLGNVWSMVEHQKAQEELINAKELAEESCRLKTELLNNLSHELRTPLNGFMGGIQLLKMTELTDEQIEYVDMLEQSSNSELALINNLLELVKLESETTEPLYAPFSLRQCIDEALKVYESAARSKQLALHQELPPDLPLELLGDRIRLSHLLHILVGNAIKFTDAGTVTIGVTMVPQDTGEQRVCITVTDTGIGIAPEKMAQIFEPFVQSDMSSMRRFGGLGLGLPICRRLVASMGGSISCENTVGTGSRFSINLPIQIHQPDDLDMAVKKQLLILLAEDESVTARINEKLLRKCGHQVLVAANGREVINLWQLKQFDLILMDIAMPEINGFEALQRIRQLEFETVRQRVPVVALTAYTRWDYHESFVSSGFDGFIQKPLRVDELEAMIARWM